METVNIVPLGIFSFATSYTQGDKNTSDGTNKTTTAGATGALVHQLRRYD